MGFVGLGLMTRAWDKGWPAGCAGAGAYAGMGVPRGAMSGGRGAGVYEGGRGAGRYLAGSLFSQPR